MLWILPYIYTNFIYQFITYYYDTYYEIESIYEIKKRPKWAHVVRKCDNIIVFVKKKIRLETI